MSNLLISSCASLHIRIALFYTMDTVSTTGCAALRIVLAHTLYPGNHRVYDRLAKDRGCHAFHHVPAAADNLLNLATDEGQHAPHTFGAQPIPVHKTARVVVSE